MNAACYGEIRKNDVFSAGPPSNQRGAYSGLRTGASPDRRVDGNRGCPNPCRRDDGPVDCKTQSVRRRLAEELGCCGCTKPETSCLVTEDTNTCCRRRSTTPRSRPEPNTNLAAAFIDPVDQIINEGLMQQKKKSSRRRSSCSSSNWPRGLSGRERRIRPSTANNHGYQPDFFDDQADMSNWQQHRDRGRHNMSRVRPSSPPPRPKCLAFEPYVDNESYSPPAVSTAQLIQPVLHDENDGRRQNMQQELERLNEQRSHLVECLEREMKIIEMMREYKQLKRVSAQLQQKSASDDQERLQRLIDEEKWKGSEFQRRSQQQNERCVATSSGIYEIPSDSPTRCPTSSLAARNQESVCASTSTQNRQLRKLSYQPPSPDTDTEDECRAPLPRRRLLAVRPLSPSDSSDSCEDANECGRRTLVATPKCPARPVVASRDKESPRRPQSSLQDSFMYYYRAIRNGAPPVTADVPKQTSSTWSTYSH